MTNEGEKWWYATANGYLAEVKVRMYSRWSVHPSDGLGYSVPRQTRDYIYAPTLEEALDFAIASLLKKVADYEKGIKTALSAIEKLEEKYGNVQEMS